ncbi:hexosaminidase d [Stylonychia lemnae]|uniref:beta-N-acetylhexosaminidase n=1 Tax=Stylonychia lemnae TaxID=5949 RepID=A0A078BDI1_STYLE|nr:hexosaminidase d [Stylonychia lemnae]|eukprot:CDW91252.1 hexosaminidase d [Stylonychia lemnae]
MISEISNSAQSIKNSHHENDDDLPTSPLLDSFSSSTSNEIDTEQDQNIEGFEDLYAEMQQDQLSESDLNKNFKYLKRKIAEKEERIDHWQLNQQVLNHQDKLTSTYLIHFACEYGFHYFLKKIKQYHGENFLFEQLKILSKSGKTAIHFASQSCQYKVLKLILKTLKRVNQQELEYQITLKDSRNKNLPLHFLLANSRQVEVSEINKCFSLLLKHIRGDQMQARNTRMISALEICIEKGYIDVLKKIIEYDESILSFYDLMGNTILHLACKQNNYEMVQVLLEKKIDYEKINHQNQSAFQVAFETGCMEICDLITKHQQSSCQSQKEIQDLELSIQEDEIIQKRMSDTSQSLVEDQPNRFDQKIFKDVLIHLDFKGAPPTISFLKKLITYLGERYTNLVTGIIFEFEDTFPYDGYLTQLRGLNFYSKDQIKDIVELTKKYKFKIVPLIQTFGHLEFALKRERFSHLREQNDNYQSLCPLKQDSKQFVLNLIEQNIQILGLDNLQLIHLGADEVFNLGSCRDCQFFSEEAGKPALFSNFIMKICKSVKKRYPKLDIMVWDDMFRNQTFMEFSHLKVNNTPIFQPCIWSYPGNFDYFNQTIKNQSFNNLCLEFKKVWVASCFRGSFEPSTTMVDLGERLQNHRLWIDKVKQNPCSQQAVQGIILTGWSRFCHETVLCELLSMTIPSLTMCLAVVERQQLNLNVIYKESVQYLNLKGKYIIQGINELIQSKSLDEFYKFSPYIDTKKQKHFCHDAFEICWNLTKAIQLLKLSKKSIKDSSVINYDKIMKRQNLYVMQQYENLNDYQRNKYRFQDNMSIDTQELNDEESFSSDTMNCDRINPNTRQKLLDYLNVSIKLLKKSVLMADRILPQYMFTRDIQEFKNSKILKYLHQAFIIFEGLTERTRSSFAIDRPFKHQYKSQFMKRMSQTPNITSSPLIQPLSFEDQHDSRGLGTQIFPQLNEVMMQLGRITSFDEKLVPYIANFSSADSLKAQKSQEYQRPSEFEIPLPPVKKSYKMPRGMQLLNKKKEIGIKNDQQEQHLRNGQSLQLHPTESNLSNNSAISEEEKVPSYGRKRESKILRKRLRPNQINSSNEMRAVRNNYHEGVGVRQKKARIQQSQSVDDPLNILRQNYE